jgi:hypothetical protein
VERVLALGEGREEGRYLPLSRRDLLGLISFRNQCMSFQLRARVNSPRMHPLEDTITSMKISQMYAW